MPSFAFSCFFDVVMMFKLPLPILIEKPTVIHCTIWKHTPIDFDKQHYKQQAQLLYIHPVAHPFLIYQVYLNFFNQQSRFSTCTCSSPSTGEIFPNCSIREKQKKPKKKKKKKHKPQARNVFVVHGRHERDKREKQMVYSKNPAKKFSHFNLSSYIIHLIYSG